jgi:hypothetical protein
MADTTDSMSAPEGELTMAPQAESTVAPKEESMTPGPVLPKVELLEVDMVNIPEVRLTTDSQLCSIYRLTRV